MSESSNARRPRIGLVTVAAGSQYAAVEILDDDGNVTGYAHRVDGDIIWASHADFTPLAEVPEPRMDEPQETWSTVASKIVAWHPLDVFYRRPDGKWLRLDSMGHSSGWAYPWSDLIDPRPTTPTERATGIVGGEDQ